ncbi:MAG: hypothetical protein IKO55_11385, partial [Kiritimatiellae bacterium]|nr:hypothetical protein [Kiritimatiellia bacterium]
RFFDIENALERSRGKTRREKRRARISFVVIFLCVALVSGLGVYLYRMISYRQPPIFEEVVFVPNDAPEEEADGRASREQLMSALPDAWVLAHSLFDDLRKGIITRPKAVAELNRLAGLAEQDDLNLFDNFTFYTSSNENAALGELLRAAAKRLSEGANSK